MIDKPITSDLARLLYNVYEVSYLTCLTIQEYEAKAKAFDIIKNKRVDTILLRSCIKKDTTPKLYNLVYDKYPLTQQEFDTLKEVLENE